MTHVRSDEVLYTGSEDGVLAGWSLAALPPLVRGDPEVDDDGGDGRDEDESDSDSSMDTDDELEISDRSDSDDYSAERKMDAEPRRREDNPVLRGRDRKGDRKADRKGKRHAPY